MIFGLLRFVDLLRLLGFVSLSVSLVCLGFVGLLRFRWFASVSLVCFGFVGLLRFR